jgi:dienelactone hydrolase
MPQILLATDIFGYTKAIETLKHRFELLCETVHILDPYDAKRMNFHDENEAYAVFNQHCGLEHYATLCSQALDACASEETILIGFSMGSSALWNALDGRTDANIKGFFGFYASQIRHSLDAKPRVPCTLIFPKNETHFDVDDVITQLDKNENVTCFKAAYLHGFMNPCSMNYNAKGNVEYCQWLEEHLSKAQR